MHVVPRLLSSVVNAMHFVGPEHCALSIVEGQSTDGTWEVLAALETHISNVQSVAFTRDNPLLQSSS